MKLRRRYGRSNASAWTAAFNAYRRARSVGASPVAAGSIARSVAQKHGLGPSAAADLTEKISREER